MILHIHRYNPEVDKEPYLQKYTIDPQNIPGGMLLHALEYIKSTIDPSLAFRRSCGAGVCGSDGMNIQGTNGLACITPLATLPENTTIYPLPGMPVIRDLVVDLSGFYDQFHSIKPYVEASEHPIERENIMTQQEAQDLDGVIECILCACCSSMCPSYWWNPKRFVGPAGLLWACRFVLDRRDMHRAQRLKDLDDLYRLYRCRSIMNCVAVCPKGLNPNQAIMTLRRMIRHDKSV